MLYPDSSRVADIGPRAAHPSTQTGFLNLCREIVDHPAASPAPPERSEYACERRLDLVSTLFWCVAEILPFH